MSLKTLFVHFFWQDQGICSTLYSFVVPHQPLVAQLKALETRPGVCGKKLDCVFIDVYADCEGVSDLQNKIKLG